MIQKVQQLHLQLRGLASRVCSVFTLGVFMLDVMYESSPFEKEVNERNQTTRGKVLFFFLLNNCTFARDAGGHTANGDKLQSDA